MSEPSAPHDPSGLVIAALRMACPSFEQLWAAHVDEWADTPGDRGVYLDVGLFAQHLVTLLERDKTSEFGNVFDAVERLFDSHDAGVREVLSVGLLESIQNVAANQRGRSFAARFKSWLGPSSLREWDALDVFWHGPRPATRWRQFWKWVAGDPEPKPVEYGCAYCRDDQNRWFGHVTQIASNWERGTILLRCPRCAALYEVTPAGTGPEQRLTIEEAGRLFPEAMPVLALPETDTIE